MKRHTLVYIIIILMIIIFLFLKSNYNHRETILDLEEKVSLSQRELSAINNQMKANDSIAKKEYEDVNLQKNIYENLIKNWLEYDIYKSYPPQLIIDSYDVSAVVTTSSGSFNLPKNSYIEIDSDFLVIEITIIEPPQVRNVEINQKLQYMGVFLEDNTLTIRLDGLKSGEQKSIRLTNILQDLLGLDDENIRINITTNEIKASEYIPSNIEAKTFSGGLDRKNFTHTYEYLSDSEWIVDYRYGGVADLVDLGEYNDTYLVKFSSIGNYESTELTLDGQEYKPLLQTKRLLLPEVIQLGKSWQDTSRQATITAIDYKVKTDFGTFETIEVTYKSNGVTDMICYYAKGLGIVKRQYYSLASELLIDVKYKD